MSWKSESCKSCDYQSNGSCKLNPPNKFVALMSYYPPVYNSTEGWQCACSKYEAVKESEK